MRMARSGRRVPSCWPTRIARASAATMPSVEPSHVPNRPCSVASVIVASIVLSPSSARKNATDAATTADPVDRSTRAASSSASVSPRSVHAANAKNARPATIEMARVGSATPSTAPMATLNACTTAVAIVIPMRIGSGLYRAENASAMSWLLSPSSATKMIPKLTTTACTTRPVYPAGARLWQSGRPEERADRSGDEEREADARERRRHLLAHGVVPDERPDVAVRRPQLRARRGREEPAVGGVRDRLERLAVDGHRDELTLDLHDAMVGAVRDRRDRDLGVLGCGGGDQIRPAGGRLAVGHDDDRRRRRLAVDGVRGPQGRQRRE